MDTITNHLDLFIKPLVAHCRMVLLPGDYVVVAPPPVPNVIKPTEALTKKKGKGKGRTKQFQVEVEEVEFVDPDEPIDVKNARRIAVRILNHLGLTLDSLDEVLYGSEDHNDPGDTVHLTGLWKKKSFLIRHEDSEEEEEEE